MASRGTTRNLNRRSLPNMSNLLLPSKSTVSLLVVWFHANHEYTWQKAADKEAVIYNDFPYHPRQVNRSPHIDLLSLYWEEMRFRGRICSIMYCLFSLL